MDTTQTDAPATRDGLLAGKTAIVTGASSGIGAVSARLFARAGASVVLAARDEAALNAVAEEIITGGGQAHAVATNVENPVSVQDLVRQTVEKFGRLDLAFNNAGGGHPPAPLADLELEDLDRCLRVNLVGVFLSMKYEIAAMLRTGGGAIVNMSSTAGLSGVPGMGAYAAAKHGVVGLTRSAAIDYAQAGIRVNAIAPGPILTEKLANHSTPAQREQVSEVVPMHRIGESTEVAAAAVWLCSDQASFVTGVTLPVDGGRTIS